MTDGWAIFSNFKGFFTNKKRVGAGVLLVFTSLLNSYIFLSSYS